MVNDIVFQMPSQVKPRVAFGDICIRFARMFRVGPSPGVSKSEAMRGTGMSREAGGLGVEDQVTLPGTDCRSEPGTPRSWTGR